MDLDMTNLETADTPPEDPEAVGGILLVALASIAACANTSIIKQEVKEPVPQVQKVTHHQNTHYPNVMAKNYITIIR